MNEEALTELLCAGYFIEVEASGRHVHLTEEDALALFGHGLTPQTPLSQPGQFLCRERVTLAGPRGQLERVAVLGPVRPRSQAEISLTDGILLGLRPPVRLSGSTEGTPGITLRAGDRSLTLREGLIAARRHIHMTPGDSARAGVRDGDVVCFRVFGERPLTFGDVVIRVSPHFRTYAHIDFDEANACGFRKGDLGRIQPWTAPL